MNQKTHNELIIEKNRLQLEIQKEKDKERKQRTRRLIQKGALLEKYLNMEDLSVEETEIFLRKLQKKMQGS